MPQRWSVLFGRNLAEQGRQILGLLKSHLEKGEIPTKTKAIYWIQGLFMWAMPKSTRAENWLPKG